ncbi:MAG: molybdate ABC transporter permease subunit [Coriobacteriia bacterium]|nr:molybdate ABC transporter permease subunit [Coriobacteriia bacterium]
MAGIIQFFSTFDWRPLFVSLKTASTAIIFVIIFSILAAWITARVKDSTKNLLDAIFTLPMVLPPTVVGFFLLIIFGRNSPVGQFFISVGFPIIFSWQATVLAAAVVSFPLMYKTVRAAFETLDEDMLNAGRIMGFSEFKILYRIMLPLSLPSVAAGTVLAFARAVGEFGATLFVAGNFPGVTQTMPIAVYFAWSGGDLQVAGVWVIMISIFSFIIVYGINAAITSRYKFKA